MPETVDVRKLFEGNKILLGGIGPNIEVEELRESEQALLDKFIKESQEVIGQVSPYLANILVNHVDLIIDFARIFKAKVRQTFGGEAPQPNNFGIAFLAPYDLKYATTPSPTEPAYTTYSQRSWVLSLTSGTAIYLLGDGTNFFKMSPTVGSRALGLIFQNGIIEVGTTPKVDQFQVRTEQVNYAPWRATTITDQPIDPRRPIYVYKTPFAIPLWYDFGIMLSAMPHTTGDSDLRLFGVVFYEYGYHSALK